MRHISLLRLLCILALIALFMPATRVIAANPPGPGDVLINEYVANSATEWVELYNTTGSDLDLSNHYIDDVASGGGSPKLIPNGTIIAAGGYYVMEFSSFLNNGGDDVRFLDTSQAALDSTTYSSATAEYSWYRSPDGGAWSGAESATPTKGASNPGGGGANPPGPGDVLINEYVANSSITEWVELYNTTGNDLDISNHYIDDIAGGGAPKQIPGGTIITAGGFYVMEFSNFLNNGGDDVRFLDAVQGVLDSTTYTFATGEHAWYRSPDGGAWNSEETDSPTKNASNTPAPAAGEVLINEFVANSATEWVELYNTTNKTLDLSSHYIDDIAGGGGTPKLIPSGTTIGPFGYYVMEFSSLLNNGGDDVRFLDPAQATLDSHTYASATAEYSWYRYPDGGTWSGVETSAPSKGSSNPGTGDTPWTPGTFEIRIFDVEQGDSQLIIFPSGFSILIDVRETSWNTGAGAAFIAQKIRSITGGSHVDVGVLSHHHLDHIGYAGYGGFWGLIENEGITFSKIVDRDAGVWTDGHGSGAVDGLCDPDFEIVWHNAGTQSGTSRNWLCYATNPANNNIYPIREIAQVGSTTQIDPPDANAVVEIVQADADSITMVDGVTPLQGDHTNNPVPPSENDYSIGIKIRYGLIDYATAGDSDGEYDTSQWGYTYNDVETDLADRFGQVDVLRANHHGSGHSTNQYYVDTLNPDASAISCGSNTFGHPAQAVLDRLNGTGDVYVTNMCDQTRNYGAAVIVDGDIILQSTDGTNYTINGTAYVASDPGGSSGTMSDIVINEILPNPKGRNSEWVELYNPTAVAIDISGMWIDDVTGGGGSPQAVPASTTIAAGGYWTMDTSDLFNNNGDDVTLLLPDGTTVVDSYTYGSTGKDKSWYRTPDGGAWATSATSNTTKGAANP